MTMHRTAICRSSSMMCECRRRMCCSGKDAGSRSLKAGLGRGRIHHCMRLIGQAEVALENMCRRASERVTFGRPIADHGVTRQRIADARIMIDGARYMVLSAAWKMGVAGNKAARKEIAMIKVHAPNVACQVTRKRRRHTRTSNASREPTH